MNRLWTALALIAVAYQSHAEDTSFDLDNGTKAQIVGQIRDILIPSYIAPNIGTQAVQYVEHALQKGAYADINDPNTLADRLTRDLQAVTHDKHLRVIFTVRQPAPAEEPPPPSVDGGFVQADRLADNVGYVKLDSFFPPEIFNRPADEVMKSVENTRALIIDLRDNQGGDPHSVAYFCSFFFDPKHPVHLNDLLWRKRGTATLSTDQFWTTDVPVSYLGKPVLLLASHRTISGGEEFLNDMKTLRRAKIIGETSAGAANPGDTVPLTVGFALFVPSGKARNPITKTNWEGQGVKANIKTPANKALEAAIKALTGGQNTEPQTEEPLWRIRTEPRPESEGILRRLIANALEHRADLADLEGPLATHADDLAGHIGEQLKRLGALQNIAFVRIDEIGGDAFHLDFEKGAVSAAVLVGKQGKAVAVDFRVDPGAPDSSDE